MRGRNAKSILMFLISRALPFSCKNQTPFAHQPQSSKASRPQTPASLEGVINLRGRIVPVVDLRSKFGMPEQPYTERTCIVVVRVQMEAGEQPMGVVVDGVVEVLTLDSGDIEDTPDFGKEVTASYVRGMAKSKGMVKILLDIDKVLSNQELSRYASIGM